MAFLPFAAHGDTLLVVKIAPKHEGRDAARHIIGSELIGLLLFDSCAQVPIVIPGLDHTTLPAPEVMTERNIKMDFLKVRFQNLSISFRGGDFGAVHYKGTASGVELLNPTPSAPASK